MRYKNAEWLRLALGWPSPVPRHVNVLLIVAILPQKPPISHTSASNTSANLTAFSQITWDNFSFPPPFLLATLAAWQVWPSNYEPRARHKS